MSVTRQAPGGGKASLRDARTDAAPQAAGPETEPDMGFDEFLRLLYSDAVARNDAEWIKWYEGWLRNMPRDNPEAYLEKWRREFVERIDRAQEKDIERSLEERLDARMARGFEERLDARMARGFEERLDARMARGFEERLDARMERNIKEGINRQIMVENFEEFEREYTSMMILRSC